MSKPYIGAIAAAIALIFSAAALAGMSKDDYKAGKDKIAAEYKSARTACNAQKANAKDVCMAEAKGKRKVARAELEADNKSGARVDDDTITDSVKEAVQDDPSLKSADINVRTSKGRVQLSGFINTRAEINRAVKVAKGVKGVKSVKNDMILKGAS